MSAIILGLSEQASSAVLLKVNYNSEGRDRF